MSTIPSFFPRLGLPRTDRPMLPLHDRTSPPIRKRSSEYSLSELSPEPDEALLSHEQEPTRGMRSRFSARRSPSPTARYSDRASNAGSASRSHPTQRFLFAGPPPPIARSMMLYRDEEDRDTSRSPPRSLADSSFARNINSVLFNSNAPSPNHSRERDYDYKPDAVWLNLQRCERALQKDLQRLLDAQSAGLAANLNPNAATPSSDASETSSRTHSITPTRTPHPGSPASRRRHVTFSQHLPTSTTTTTNSGTPVPVRQPRPKPLTLPAARANLARTITLLADLKADEDAQLTAALSARKQALAQLRRWVARREDIASELRALEEDGDEPLGRELSELEREREAVRKEISELEERLGVLKRRGRWLDGRVGEVRSRREAGLSGYRGALREVEGSIGGLLDRPGVRPLDGEIFGSVASREEGVEGGSIGGVEFLRLRPERRTAEMAREWWEGEVAILERRKAEVDKERAALEDGVEVWKEAVRLVSEFEAGLSREMKGDGHSMEGSNGKGKGKGREGESGSPSSSPLVTEQGMYAQLDKMRLVMAALEARLQMAEERGWNLLICAIGAELEAFRQGFALLRETLGVVDVDAGVQDDDDNNQGDSTPHLGRSSNLSKSAHRLDEAEPSGGGRLLDLNEVNPGGDRGPDKNPDREPEESENEVPPDLLAAVQEEEHELSSPALSRESSNEVPAEFLTEHPDDKVYQGFGSMG